MSIQIKLGDYKWGLQKEEIPTIYHKYFIYQDIMGREDTIIIRMLNFILAGPSLNT